MSEEVLVKWSNWPKAIAIWEKRSSLHQCFPRALAWGQAGSQAPGDVTTLLPNLDDGSIGQETRRSVRTGTWGCPMCELLDPSGCDGVCEHVMGKASVSHEYKHFEELRKEPNYPNLSPELHLLLPVSPVLLLPPTPLANTVPNGP